MLLVAMPLLLGVSFVQAATAAEQAKVPVVARATNSVPDAAAIAKNNLGVGLMGRFEYARALALFTELADSYPEWLELRVNQAIAALNRQLDGDEAAALSLVEGVLNVDPGHLRAHYVAGLLRLYLGAPARAQDHFRHLVATDPGDVYATYYLAQCHTQLGNHQEALTGFTTVIERDPYLRSAYYGAFQALQRLGRRGEARDLISQFQRLAKNPRARLAEFRYTRMGPKAEALAIGSTLPQPLSPISGPLFESPQVLVKGSNGKVAPELTGRKAQPVNMTPIDSQGDGRLDLFIAALNSGERSNSLLLGTATGGLEPTDDHPLMAVTGVNAALWGDYDNDGLVDVYLCREGPNQLWRQAQPGVWDDVTKATDTGGGDSNTVDGAFFDADHDGDLDLFLVNADGPNELLSNNHDGSFRPLATHQAIAGNGQASQGILPVDLDADRDVDLILLNRGTPHEVYLNDRLWSYRPAQGWEVFTRTPALAAIAADLNADGYSEVISLTPDGRLLQWTYDHQGNLTQDLLHKADMAVSPWGQLGLLDADGDGGLDLLLAHGGGWSLINRRGEVMYQADADVFGGLRGIRPFLFSPEKGPAILGLSGRNDLIIWPAGSGRHPFLNMTFSGKQDGAETLRSNASGIGASVKVRSGSYWSVLPAYRTFSGPGQGLEPLTVGLGRQQYADFISVDWTDGVFQSELQLQAGRVHSISETQRQLSSCPVLFAWNGEKYAFISDFLGVGGIGYAVGPGEYAPPRPWENLLLPPASLALKNGHYELKITEPMEEVAYLDSVRLVAWDLPEGWQMVLDERMGIQGPEPTGQARFYQQEVLPSRVIDQRGREFTKLVQAADGNAVPVGPLDHRFVGRLRETQELTLDFAQSLDHPPGEPMLVADGWVEYPYSQTMFAAWQAKADYRAPSIEARDANGKWHLLLDQFGYPAGMPRRMSVPLADLPRGTTALRLRSNMEIYWDRLAVAFAEPQPKAKRRLLSLASARMAKPGFPKWSSGAQRKPHYDYDRRLPFWDTRYMAGYYTRLGPVTELVAEIDDAVAIIGPGEEVHLKFDAGGDTLSSGWTRYFVLESNGWAKDMDLFTKDGETVGPLPTSGRAGKQRDVLHTLYNTRYQSGY